MNLCMFCNKEEVTPGYKPPTKTKFLCSTCVNFFLGKTQEELISGYNLAIEKEYMDKALSIKMFMDKQEVKKNGNIAGNNKRSRITRPIRYKKRSA